MEDAYSSNFFSSVTKNPTNTAWISLQEHKTLSGIFSLMWMLKEVRKGLQSPMIC